ncbi:MAG: tRNA pseudouridine(38-40) synthase TruA [Kiritimatiellae bacterium]|nr:tRNA pseudouridine(38-40) synthase TruA [Kiritimatiellia bacterium]
MSRRYKIVLAFDGTAYAGYQLQDNAATVQQRLEEVLAYLDRRPVRVFGSSRTDAGVHAHGFCCHFDLDKPIPAANLVRAMNSRLPDDIRVLKASRVRDDFDARKDALGKEYRYFLYNADILPPHLAPYWAFQHRPLDIAAMQAAAAHFTGRHDFTSFAANPRRDISSTVRTIFSFTVTRRGPRIVFAVRGDGFLYKQVRSMVGFLVRVGRGEERPEAVADLLARHPARTARVPTATGRGLFLWKVFYGRRGTHLQTVRR